MNANFSHIVSTDFAGARLDAYLGSLDACPSRSACAHMIEEGKVAVNGEVVTSKKTMVYDGDSIQAEIDAHKGAAPTLVGQNIPLDIRFEDDYLLVLNKQKGLVCHPAPGHDDGTLANALVYHCGPDHVGRLQGDDRPGIVHRLDRDTSGLMLAAKDDKTQGALQDLIRLRTLDRRYITLVHGYIAPDTGMIDAPITRSPKDRLRMGVSDDLFARQAITTFTTLERFEAGPHDDGYSLLECHLYTGRTHQIRVHMQHIHHSCVGDPLYGRNNDRADRGLTRQFLHSWRVEFDHPITGEHILIHDELPYDLLDMLEEIQPLSMGRTEAGEQIVPLLGL